MIFQISAFAYKCYSCFSQNQKTCKDPFEDTNSFKEDCPEVFRSPVCVKAKNLTGVLLNSLILVIKLENLFRMGLFFNQMALLYEHVSPKMM